MFLLAVLVASSLVVIQGSQPSKAESLLHRITCTVGGWLWFDCTTTPPDDNNTTPPEQTPPGKPASEPNPPPTTTPAPESEPASNLTTQQNPPPTQAVTGPTVDESPPPLELDEELAGEVSMLTPVPLLTMTDYQYPNNVLLSANDSAAGEVLGAQTSDAALVATDQGWRFLGMLWYWWVLIIGGVVGLGALIKATVTNSFASIVKRT